MPLLLHKSSPTAALNSITPTKSSLLRLPLSCRVGADALYKIRAALPFSTSLSRLQLRSYCISPLPRSEPFFSAWVSVARVYLLGVLQSDVSTGPPTLRPSTLSLRPTSHPFPARHHPLQTSQSILLPRSIHQHSISSYLTSHPSFFPFPPFHSIPSPSPSTFLPRPFPLVNPISHEPHSIGPSRSDPSSSSSCVDILPAT